MAAAEQAGEPRTTSGILRIAAVGDVHASVARAGEWREAFVEISQHADVLCLCGDLTNLGTRAEAEALAEDLRVCRIPIMAVLGNHDHHCDNAAEIESVLAGVGVKFLEEEVHSIDGVGFAGVKGFGGGFDGRMLGAFGEPAIKAFVQETLDQAMRLEHALHQLQGQRSVVLLHYAPIEETVQGEPEALYPFLGSSRLAETIDRFEEVQAVLHGHAHHGTYEGHTRKGVPVYNVAASITKPTGKAYALIAV
jgi:Icc-related predicted phosphoesterase